MQTYSAITFSANKTVGSFLLEGRWFIVPIEYAIFISLISTLGTVVGVTLGMNNFRRLQRADDQSEGAQNARIVAQLEGINTRIALQLEHIDAGVNSVKYDMAAIKEDLREQRDRMVRVEESTKQAHKRLDEIVNKRVVGTGID